MEPQVDQELLGAARKVGPLARERAAEAERERRLARPVMDALRKAGFFRLYVARSVGGLETDPLTLARVCEELSFHDSAAGWTIMVANAGPWWGARLPAETYEEFWGKDPDRFLTAAFYPPVEAVPVDGGYRLKGQRPFASLVHDASWVLLTALVMERGQPRLQDGMPVVIGAHVPKEQVKVLDTWHTLGMRGTDSHDVVVEDALVPARRTFPVVPEFQPNRHCTGPLYQVPAMAAATLAYIPPVALGVARAAIEEFRTLAQSKARFPAPAALKDRPAAQRALGEAEASLRAGRALLYEVLGEAWQRARAGQKPTLAQRADALMASVKALQASAHAVELVWRAAGTAGIYQRSPLERHFRDVQVLRQHGFVAEGRYETVGQVMLGAPPELGFVAF